MSLFDSTILAAATATAVTAQPTPVVAITDVIAASKALTTATTITPPGMLRPYLPHQGAAHVACNGAIARHGCALLGDDMGLGKTQVLFGLVAERIANGGYAIMIAPPVAKAGYIGDLAAAFPTLRFAHLFGRTATNRPDADIYFLSDDSLTLAAWLTDTHTDAKGHKVQTANAFAMGAAILTRDEIHRDKGSRPLSPSGRAKTMIAVGNGLRTRNIPMVGATGTLLTNRPSEAYAPLMALGGADLLTAITPNAHSPKLFLHVYCAPQTIRVAGGRQVQVYGADASRMPQLHEKLRSTVYVRREKSDLGNALPHSGWLIKPIALNGVLTRYNRLEKEFLNVILEEEGPEAMWRSAKNEAMRRTMDLWEEMGIAIADATVEYVAELVEQDRPVVVFYNHNDAYLKLATGLSKASISYTTISGKVTGDARSHAIATFQAGQAMVMLAQIQAAGMAVTLTAAKDAVFSNVPWSAGSLKQCADRILRCDDRTYARAANGEQITWHVLQACQSDGAPTFAAALWQVLEEKALVCDAVNAGKPVTINDESVIQQAITAWFPTARKRYS